MNSSRFRLILPSLVVILLGRLSLDNSVAWAADPRSYWEESVKKETAGDLDGALSAELQYLDEGGDAYLGNIRMGWLWSQKKEYDKAAASYEQAHKANPRAITPLLMTAAHLQATKHVDAAAKAYGEILKLDVKNYTANLALGGILYGKKDYADAATCFARLTGLYPEEAGPSSGLAWCLYMLGRKDAATPLFLRVLTLNSQFPHAAEGYKLCTGLDPSK